MTAVGVIRRDCFCFLPLSNLGDDQRLLDTVLMTLSLPNRRFRAFLSVVKAAAEDSVRLGLSAGSRCVLVSSRVSALRRLLLSPLCAD